MKVLIDHTADHTNFLSYMIWHISWFTMILQNKASILDTDLPEFFLYNATPHPPTFDSVAKRIPDVSFKVISPTERRSIFQNIDDPILHLESTLMLPRIVYLSDCALPEEFSGKNLCLPLVTYKYNYKTVTFEGKEFRVKNFVPCQDLFFETNFIPDWDERFCITHSLLAKLGDDPPPISPSPLLHDWGTNIRLIRNNSHDGNFDADKDVFIGKMSHAVHKFERVADDSI